MTVDVHSRQLVMAVLVSAVMILKERSDEAHAEYPPLQVFDLPPSITPLPCEAATPDPLSSPPRGEGHVTKPPCRLRYRSGDYVRDSLCGLRVVTY
jgi:hypothetical protein